MVTHYHSVVDFETVMCKIVDGDAANMTFSVKLVMRRFRKNESEERVCLHLLQTRSFEIFSLVISRSQSDWQYFHHMYCALLSGSWRRNDDGWPPIKGNNGTINQLPIFIIDWNRACLPSHQNLSQKTSHSLVHQKNVPTLHTVTHTHITLSTHSHWPHTQTDRQTNRQKKKHEPICLPCMMPCCA